MKVICFFFRKMPTFRIAFSEYKSYWNAGSACLLHDILIYIVLQGSVRRGVYVAYNFVTGTCADCNYVRGNWTPSDYLLFTVSKQNYSGRKFEVDRELETDMTLWLISEGMCWYQQGVVKRVL